MYSATIKSIEKTVFQVDNQTYLAVELEILKDGELVETRKLAFPLDTSEEAITAELAKYVATYADDQRLAEESAKVDAANKAADELIAKLSGTEIQ